MKKLLTLAAVLFATAAVLAGCSSSGAVVGNALPSLNIPSDNVVVTAEDEPSDAPPSSDSSEARTARFGETFTYKDGLQVTIGKPRKFTPSEYAGAKKAVVYLRFKVTLKNGTAKRFEPTIVSGTMSSAGKECEEIFDTDNGLDGSPSTTLLPGRVVSYSMGFGVSDQRDLVLEFTPDFDHDAAVFSTT
jgi:hypothetical protein